MAPARSGCSRFRLRGRGGRPTVATSLGGVAVSQALRHGPRRTQENRNSPPNAAAQRMFQQSGPAEPFKQLGLTIVRGNHDDAMTELGGKPTPSGKILRPGLASILATHGHLFDVS